MQKTANARFAITSWDEKPYYEADGEPKLTKASVVKKLTGDIEGESRIEYTMMYRSKESAMFVGLERVVASVAGKSGSFVMQRNGVFENGTATETYSIVPGSGTGDLRDIRGSGSTAVGHGMEHPFTLSYEIE